MREYENKFIEYEEHVLQFMTECTLHCYVYFW